MGPRQVSPVPEEISDTLLGIHVGIDIAVTFDYTAVAVVQVRERVRANAPEAHMPARETYYRVLQVRRWPHNLAAPEIAAALVHLFTGIRAELIAERERLLHFGAPQELPARTLYADATGMGKAVVPSIRQALSDHPETRDVVVRPITFTHGERYDRWKPEPSVGKTHLVTNLQALLHTDRLDLPKHDPESPLLRHEIDVYRINISQDGKETFGAISAAHDDLVTAVALACLDDPRQFRVTYGKVVY